MARDIINEVNNRTDLRRIFKEIREDAEKAKSREDLSELYKRTVYMIMMTHASPLEVKFDRELKRWREITEREFARTVRMISIGRQKKLAPRPITTRNGMNWRLTAMKQKTRISLNPRMGIRDQRINCEIINSGAQRF